jgi:hypothetical protein
MSESHPKIRSVIPVIAFMIMSVHAWSYGPADIPLSAGGGFAIKMERM